MHEHTGPAATGTGPLTATDSAHSWADSDAAAGAPSRGPQGVPEHVREEYCDAIGSCLRRLAGTASKADLQRVLVIGFGTGLEIRLLTRLLPNAQITGVDPDPDAARFMRARVAEQSSQSMPDPHAVDLHTATIQSYLAGHPTDKWDLIVAYFVLHLIPDVDDVLTALAEQLMPDGALITADWQSPGVVPLEPHMDVVDCEVMSFETVSPTQPDTRGVCWRTSRRPRE